ncbi:MAG: hypothetical protein IKW90_00975 [Lachnospiraceae bacterium]|nr:hypothetical protein [Lachnospiraceae bacterium]
MRRFTVALLGVFLSMLVFLIPDIKVSADDGNDFYEKAIQLSNGSKAKDYLEDKADHDWFKYTVAKNAVGTVRFKVERDAADSGCWSYKLYVLEDDKLINLEDTNGTSYLSELYSYAPGTELYLEVFYADYRSNTISDKYNVSVVLNDNPPDGCTWAKEKDNSYEKANKLNNETVLSGLLNTKDDTDWYVYTTKGTNDVRIKIDRTDADKGCWAVALYEMVDDNLVVIEEKRDASSWISLHRSFISGTTLYIKLYFAEYNGNTKNVPYKVSVSCKDEPIEGYKLAGESKDNAAVKLTSATPMTGILNYKSDSDWFVYTVQSQDKFKFKFGQAVGDTGKWSYDIYEEKADENLETLYSSREVTNYTSDEFSFKKGTKIYLKVYYSDYNGNTPNEFYTIKAIDNVKNENNTKDSKDNKSDNDTQGINTPFSILVGTNVVVGKADAGAKVSVKYGKKTYTATADSNGIYRVKTAKLKKSKKVIIWQTVDNKDSEKMTFKVVNKY